MEKRLLDDRKRQMQKAIILLCGLPACGKTTLCTSLNQIWRKNKALNVRIISIDTFYKKSTFDPSDWHAAREDAYRTTAKVLETDGIVIVDDTMFYRSMRRKYFSLAVEYHAAFRIVRVSCSFETCMERNKERSTGRIPENVIRHVNNVFEEPESNLYWESSVFEFDTDRLDPRSQSDCESLAIGLLENWKVVFKKDSESSSKPHRLDTSSQSNGIHLLDLKIRSAISEMVQKTQCERSRCARSLNALRSECLTAFKKANHKNHEPNPNVIFEALDRFLEMARIQIDRLAKS